MVREDARRLPLLPVGAALVLSGLLALLGTLQYRWLGEVSASERAQLRAGLRTRAESFGKDFDHEITRAFVWLQLDSATLRQRDWAPYAQRYSTWASRAAFPRMVRDVYLIEKQEKPKDSISLSRYDVAKASFSSEGEWPAFLTGLRARIDGTGAAPTPPPPLRQIWEETVLVDGVPALVAPIASLAPRDAAPRGALREPPAALGLVVIVFDAEQIRTEVLPALARRHFGDGGPEVGYAVTVTSRSAPGSVLFTSERPRVQAREDEGVNLFTLRFEDLSGDDRTALSSLRRLSDRRDRARRQFRGLVPGPDAGFWRLAASLRGESLDEAVDSARRRNLAVSFGVLLLLGGSVGLIVAGAVRVRRLAERQMDFVAGVTHELRTPIAVVCSAGENLADGLVVEASQVKKYGATIRDEGRRLSEMVEQALDFAGIHSGRRRLASEPLDVARVLEEVCTALSLRLRDRGFTLERRIAGDLPAVRGDSGALRRVFQNLLDNAMKYSGASRWIGVRAEAAVMDGRPVVRIAVEDRGLGIAHHEKERVFEAFFRGREAQASLEHGFGLGLSLVRRIVTAHGGHITVESEASKGSTFVVTLPALEAQESVAIAEGKVNGIPDSAR